MDTLQMMKPEIIWSSGHLEFYHLEPTVDYHRLLAFLITSSPSRDVAQLFCDKNSSLGFINLVSTKPTLSPRSATPAPPSVVSSSPLRPSFVLRHPMPQLPESSLVVCQQNAKLKLLAPPPGRRALF